ncbi:thioredoxin domain-containing protein [Reichenbachiella sp.]|uniref:thioredoxin family protein n=1 Tax=Reichenbachiella sp. TaxID=2184521 RepID=UPI003B5A1D2D
MSRDNKLAKYSSQLLTLLGITMIGCLFCGCGKDTDSGPTSANAKPVRQSQSAGHVLKLSSSDEFNQLLDENRIVLVDFYADWCGPCHMLKPTINEIAVEYSESIKVVAVDIDKFSSLASRFKINSIPDIRIFENAQLENSFIGVQPKENYTRVLNRLIDN